MTNRRGGSSGTNRSQFATRDVRLRRSCRRTDSAPPSSRRNHARGFRFLEVSTPDRFVPPETEPWPLLRRTLHRSRRGQGDEDIVQEAVFRVWLRLGDAAVFGDCVRLGHKILHDLAVDVRRRRQPHLLGDDDHNVAAVEQQSPIDVWERVVADVGLQKRLGERAVQLLAQLFSGVRRNKALAAHLHTSPAAIRRRRVRIARILEEHVAQQRDGALAPR